jgi:phosphoribosylaminoimidazole-succinocarboxamide synthase
MLNKPNLQVVVLSVGSDSDLPKVRLASDTLKQAGIFVLEGINSIHRTPEALEAVAKAHPEVPPVFKEVIQKFADKVNITVGVFIGAAGWAAHLPWWLATHAPWAVVIALPVPSSAAGIIDSANSMLDMPPEVPNGVAGTPEIAGKMASKIIHLDLPKGYNKIALPQEYISKIPVWILEELWIEIDETSPIKIHVQPIYSDEFIKDSSYIDIVVPIHEKTITTDDRDVGCLMADLGQEALFMGLQVENDSTRPNLTNALLFATQVLATKNPSLRQNLIKRRKRFHDQVREKDTHLTEAQNIHLENMLRLNSSWLWPRSKPMDFSNSNLELQNLGYTKFYTGKNADLYIIPYTDPIQVLMVRSDRTSVFDIKLDLEIEWKGEIQTQISKKWAEFAVSRWFPTCFTELPYNIPESLIKRCQSLELCNPLSMEIDGREQWLELIMRNYNTGSLYNKFYKKSIPNPYGIDIPVWMNEWDKFPEPIFTPTTKDKNDTPVNSALVREIFPELIVKIERLFAEFTEYMYEKGYVVVDTKVEVFINSRWEPVLGDEIFTPESSRFIKKEDFEAGRYISADKQIIRNLGIEFKWQERWVDLLKENPKAKLLPVAHEITSDMKVQVIWWYNNILSALTE